MLYIKSNIIKLNNTQNIGDTLRHHKYITSSDA